MKENIFPEKYLKKLNSLATGYTDTIDGADTEEIKKKILSAENNIFEIDNEKDNNDKLKDLKAEIKKINGPFQEAKSLETAKIKYCLHILTNRGVNI